ncbi:MAG: hypothetical protein J5954_01415 [Prevotella sp.]|nr:hypothetical protein [Prevotella sp.]
MRKILPLLLLAVCVTMQAERRPLSLTDSLHYKVEMQATLSSGDHTPLWLNANRYGLSSLEKTNGYLRAAVERPLSASDGQKWALGYGLDIAGAYHFTSKAIVQQAYVEGRWLKGVLTIGAKQQPMELKNQELSSGSQTLGINARPIPQVRVALADYWTIPYTRGWLSIKGHIAYGMQTDDRWQKEFTNEQSRYTEHSLYHSKAGYLKIGKEDGWYPVSLELGLEMACQFGGTAYMVDDNTSQVKSAHNLKSFWHAFMPLGTDVTDGTYTNAEGNHLGSWLMRLNFDYDNWYLGIYADKFFEDNSSMLHVSFNGYGEGDEWNVKKEKRYFVHSFKDWLLGAELKLKRATWLNNIVAEFLYTKYQGGPVYHDKSPIINEHICGRDNFYNHHLQTGWQHWGQVMGNPLYRSPLYNEDGTIRVLNNRFVAWHVGLAGNPLDRLHYRFLATWQRGWGTYDNLFRDPETSVSIMGEACYQFPKGWQLKGAMGFDSGKIYGKNFGCQLTIAKTGLLNKKRIKR